VATTAITKLETYYSNNFLAAKALVAFATAKHSAMW